MKTTLYFTLTLLTFVTLAFVPSGFAQDFRPIVRLIYFVPSDRQPQPDIDTKFDGTIKRVQRGYEDIMQAHGFGKKTFLFETDAKGNAVVHTVKGQSPEKHYTDSLDTRAILKEIGEQFDTSKDFYLIVIDISGRLDGSSRTAGVGTARGGSAGWALIPTSGLHGAGILAAHELAHAFGLRHDHRPDAKRVVSDIVVIHHSFLASFCAAEWLDVHRAFNPEQPILNQRPTFDMLPLSFVSSPNVIRLRFKVTDHDGIHQVQLMTPERDHSGALLDCKELNGNSSATVEFVTSSLTLQSESVSLQMIDVHGDISRSPEYPIDVLSLLPPPKVVSIPDPNLAAAVRETLGLAPGNSITQLDMLGLTTLTAVGRQITNLTGLEHAIYLQNLNLLGNQIKDVTPLLKLTNLRRLEIGQNQIRDITPFKFFTNLRMLGLEMNPITDITVLSSLKNLERLSISDSPITDIRPVWELTQLRELSLRFLEIRDLSPLTKFTGLTSLQIDGTQVSDISPLAGMTNLRNLSLGGNQITDVSPLAGMTNLGSLTLVGNQIIDVSPLAELRNLTDLRLWGNPIKNRKPLFELLRKNPEIKIYLEWGGEPLPVTLSHFRAEHTDIGVVLKWITQSEVDNAGFYIYRSETREAEFKVVNPTMIQGAGTTSVRNEYTWTDTTAKPNVAYYYQIEDISHAGVRKKLATVRMRGLVSATGKLTTRWADLKMNN